MIAECGNAELFCSLREAVIAKVVPRLAGKVGLVKVPLVDRVGRG